MIRLIGREFQSTQEIQRSKMRFGADIQQGPYRPQSNFDYRKGRLEIIHGDLVQIFFMNMVVAKNTIGQNFQHYRIDYLKYAIDWQLQHY